MDMRNRGSGVHETELIWHQIVSQKGDPKMIRLSSSMRTYNTNLQGATWKVPFGMRKRISRYPDNLGLR